MKPLLSVPKSNFMNNNPTLCYQNTYSVMACRDLDCQLRNPELISCCLHWVLHLQCYPIYQTTWVFFFALYSFYLILFGCTFDGIWKFGVLGIYWQCPNQLGSNFEFLYEICKIHAGVKHLHVIKTQVCKKTPDFPIHLWVMAYCKAFK